MAKKLTAKMERFCEAIALEGMTLVDAYASAYAAENMSRASCYRESSLLMSDPKIAQRVNTLRARQEQARIAAGLSDRERVLDRLRMLLESGEGTRAEDVQLKAARMLGESVALFKDVSIEERGERRPEEIMEELEQVLSGIEMPEQKSTH